MAYSKNRVELIGNLGRDPEFYDIGKGRRVASLSVATSESWKDKDTGERKERTDWHLVKVYNQALLDSIEKYYRKGLRVSVEGTLQTRGYLDEEETKRYVTEVVVSGFKGECRLVDPKKDVEAAEAKALPVGETPLGIPAAEAEEIPF